MYKITDSKGEIVFTGTHKQCQTWVIKNGNGEIFTIKLIIN